MKKQWFGVIAFGVLGLAAPAMGQDLSAAVFSRLPGKVYIPRGFDSNDTNVQVVVSGLYPNTCFSRVQPEVTVDEANRRIEIRNRVRYQSGAMCLELLVPYTHTIPLTVDGKATLDAGEYGIFFEESNTRVDPELGQLGGSRWHQLGTLPVAEATVDTRDNALYAPVSDVSAWVDSEGMHVRLGVAFHKSCLSLDQDLISERGLLWESSDVFVVLPFVRVTGEMAECRDERRREEVEWVLPQPEVSDFLVHVRTMDEGGAINAVVQY